MNRRKVAKSNPPASSAFLLLLFSSILCCFAAGCGAPGEPTPPSPPIPEAVKDLTAKQLGDAVLLDFTLPRQKHTRLTSDRNSYTRSLRGSLRPDGTPDPRSFHLVDTVPGPILSTYVHDGHASFPSPLQPDELRARAGEIALFRVRTRVSERKVSADSNEVSVSVYPVPQRINDLQARVANEKTIQLTWTAPTSTSSRRTTSSDRRVSHLPRRTRPSVHSRRREGSARCGVEGAAFATRSYHHSRVPGLHLRFRSRLRLRCAHGYQRRRLRCLNPAIPIPPSSLQKTFSRRQRRMTLSRR